MRVVLTHPEMGVYLGSFLGMGFWTLLDTAGQTQAVTFIDTADLIDYITTWVENSDPSAYEFVPVDCGEAASIADLVKAGLGDRLGDMLNNAACISI
jgi:hypothetical protein